MKTVCVYHSIDLDGWMSAAIVKHWSVLNAPMYIDFIGYNYGQPIPDLSEYDRVIMCDVSFPLDEMIKLHDKIEWIDRHISAIESIDRHFQQMSMRIAGKRDTGFAACELTWKYFFTNEEMPEIVRLLGRYDCFGHKGTDEEQKVLEFQYGARQVITNYEEAYEWLTAELYGYQDFKDTNEIQSSGESIYRYLCTEAKQVYKNGFEVEFHLAGLVDPYDIKVLRKYIKQPVKCVDTFETYRFICINRERFNPVNFGIDYHKEGYDGAACFHYANGEWHFSLYNDNGLVDCSQIAKQFGGGGHKGAAGFIIKNITDIIK